jgi:hypothetical protein
MSGSFYVDRTVTARKEHECGDCGRPIPQGEQYHRVAGAAYGDFWTWKHCAHCAALRRMIRDIDEESYYDEDGLNVADWVANYGSAVEIRELDRYDTIKALGHYRIIRWFQNRWRDRNGQLREVPVLP